MPTSDSAFSRVAICYGAESVFSPTSTLLAFSPQDYYVTPTRCERLRVSAATGGTTCSLAAFTGVQLLAVHNHDLDNYIEVSSTYTDGASTDHANVMRVPPLGTIMVNGPLKIAANLTLTAHTAACIVDVAIVGT